MVNPRPLNPEESPRAFFGSELRRLREAAGLSQEKLGEKVFCSGSYIGQLEVGTRRPQVDLAERLDEILGADGHLTRVCKMANKATPYADYFADAADLEKRAESISEFASTLMPGLLQSETYARAVIRCDKPFAPEEVVEQHVRARLDRAQILDDPTRPKFWAILHETVLRMIASGPEGMAEQLAHLLDLIRDHRVLVQVIPFSAGPHPLAGQMLSLMTFRNVPDVLYTENQFTGHLLDDPVIVAEYREAYDHLRAIALSPDASRATIESVMKEYEDHDRRP